jgi:glycosyltransferase involved in cell wall biosynthesis
MRIALYHPWIYLKSGLERTILEIARRSRHDWQIFTSHYDADGTYPELRQFSINEINRVSVQRNYGAVLSASMHIVRSRLPLDDVDALVVCCDGVGSFILLRNGSRPAINLCFTPLRAVYDAEYRRRHLARQGLGRALAILIEKTYVILDRLLWRRYREVVCISNTVRERVVSGQLYPESRLQVMYPGIDAAAIVPSTQFEPFFFLPGRIVWTKNIELGIEGYLQFRRAAGAGYRLVVAGMVDNKSQEYFARLRALAGTDNDIEFHVDPSDAQMRDYYQRCTAVLFTSFNEDLGLTPMEAMTCGKPVIAVNCGGPREVIEDGKTGFLVPAAPGQFAHAMLRLISDPTRPRVMGLAGAERVKRYTWDKFVSGLDDLLESTVTEAASATNATEGQTGHTQRS